MPKIIFLLTRKTIWGLILSLLSIVVIIFVVHPRLSIVKASPSENNTSVFTGQFLPAFLGGAYDPTEAYKRIAGLPVYVFGYDRWSGTQAMVINNYAIRTQIRADGSFQVQGLPTAAHYAVYFPYKLSASGTVERTDCVSGAGALDPCVNDTAKTAEFRWPDDGDQIKDVFSYAQGDASAVTIGNTQVDNQQVKLGKVFLTNETRVDIVNHINVFPLVPNKVLKIVLKDYTDDSSFEVVAQRIVGEKTEFESASNSLTVPVNFPIIRGRTSSALAPGSGYKIYNKTFQAYAPPGKYVISYWRTESNNPSYKNWDTKSPVNSIKNGLSLERVARDWRKVSEDPDLIGPVWPNGIKIWGTVTDKDGYLMDGTDENHLNVLVDLKSDTGLENTYAGRNDENNLDKNFYAPGLGSGLPTRTIWGIYAIAQAIPESIALTFPTQIEMPWVYVKNEAGKNFQQDPPKMSSIVRGTDGPQRIDLSAIRSTTHSSGYDSGIVLKINCSDPGCPILSNAAARIKTAHENVSASIPAVTKLYTANRLGVIIIPDIDLKRDEIYAVEIRAGDYYTLTGIDYPTSGYAEETVNIERIIANASGENYKILGIIPVPWLKTALADSNGKIYGKVRLVLTPGAKLTNTKVIFQITSVYNLGAGTCNPPECGVVQPDGTLGSSIPTATEAGGEFQIAVKKPPTSAEAIATCSKKWLANVLLDSILHTAAAASAYCASLTNTDKIVDSYKLIIQGTYVSSEGKQEQGKYSASGNFQVNSQSSLINDISLAPEDSCDTAFPGGPDLNFFNSLGNFVGGTVCSISTNFVQNVIPGALKSIQDNLLQMRPITSQDSVVKVWTINRGLANIFFVILLIVIGIATILRLEPKTYNLGILLPRLFISIALANFSLLIVQILIDTSNVLSQTFFSLLTGVLQNAGWAGGAQTVTGVAGASLAATFAGILTTVLLTSLILTATSGGALGIAILSFLLSLILSLVVFALGLFMLFLLRYVVVWIAVVLAPILFVFSVIPSKTLGGLTSMFWNTILPLIFMGPVMAFVLGMGMLVLVIGGGQNDILAGFGSIAMGIITLFGVLQVPGMLGGMFKGGLASNLGLVGKGGTQGMAGDFVAGKLGAKDMDTLKKERLNAPQMEAFAQRGSMEGGRFGALGGMFRGLTGRYAQEATAEKSLKEEGESGLDKPWVKRKAEIKELQENTKFAGLDDTKNYKQFASFLSNPGSSIYTGRTTIEDGQEVAATISGRQFVEMFGGGYDAKGKIKNEKEAIKTFYSIKAEGLKHSDPTKDADLGTGGDLNTRLYAGTENVINSKKRAREQFVPKT